MFAKLFTTLRSKKVNKENLELIIPDRTREWLLKCCPLVVSLDFSGYIFCIDEKRKWQCAITLSSDVIYYSTDPKKPFISKRQNKQITKKLLKNKFFELGINPFPILKELPSTGAKISIIPSSLFEWKNS